MKIIYLNTIKQFDDLLNNNDKVSLYGAGKICKKIMDYIQYKYLSLSKLKCIWISNLSNINGNIDNIQLLRYDEKKISKDDIIIIAMHISYLGDKYFKTMLENSKARVYCIFFDSFYFEKYDDIYSEILSSIKPYISEFSIKKLENQRSDNSSYRLWTCWWQGLDFAPDVVKMCVNSQMANCPKNVEYIIITEKNYKEYVDIPDYVIDKVNRGFITLTTLSDIIRAYLIMHYGGIWIDATVLLLKQMPMEYFNSEYFTCKGGEFDIRMPSLWFIGGKKGCPIFEFIYNAFMYYFKYNNTIIDYFMVLYFINIFFDCFPKQKSLYNDINDNNENSAMLGRFARYSNDGIIINNINEAYVQKLSYKSDYSSFDSNTQTVYEYYKQKFMTD